MMLTPLRTSNVTELNDMCWTLHCSRCFETTYDRRWIVNVALTCLCYAGEIQKRSAAIVCVRQCMIQEQYSWCLAESSLLQTLAVVCQASRHDARNDYVTHQTGYLRCSSQVTRWLDTNIVNVRWNDQEPSITSH